MIKLLVGMGRKHLAKQRDQVLEHWKRALRTNRWNVAICVVLTFLVGALLTGVANEEKGALYAACLWLTLIFATIKGYTLEWYRGLLIGLVFFISSALTDAVMDDVASNWATGGISGIGGVVVCLFIGVAGKMVLEYCKTGESYDARHGLIGVMKGMFGHWRP